MIRPPPTSTRLNTLFPYTTLFRSSPAALVERYDLVMHGRLGLHARGPGRHARDGHAHDFRTLLEQALDDIHRHVPFHDVALHQGGVAGGEAAGHEIGRA